MSRVEQRLELEIALRGSLGSPIAEMTVVGEFDRLQVVRFDQAAVALPPALERLTVDLTRTTILDSAALGSLIRLRHVLATSDAGLEVLVHEPFQVTVMRVSGLEDFLGVRIV